ncbi:ankyrin repeat domain-containing protein [Herbaspirillum sp. RV1423]|uniref:ankyrin repeat domain-containing protein n=1 Tax=Herbaspirillum sp. RV1423 TaxID=1443993 RepID=UPI0004B032F5|nr:ankyrin repeat domain-containing protein [Herbaspirillum sp. RV1423]
MLNRFSRFCVAALLALTASAGLMPAAAHAGTYDDYFTAVKMDAPRELQDLIKRGLGPNMVEPQRGYSALMLSIREDSMKAFDVLFNTPGVDLEIKAKNGDTAIMVAAFYGNLPVVKLLLDKEVEVNRPGWTALHYAAINGNAAIIKLLLDASAYIDAESPDEKMTPVMLAAVRGRTFAVRLLKEEGADISLKNADGMTALDLARRFNQQDVVEELTGQHTSWSAQKPGS